MPINIKGAPKTGWYLPKDDPKITPVFWTGICRFYGEKLQGWRIAIYKFPDGPRIMPEWVSDQTIRALRKKRRLVRALPETWRDQPMAGFMDKAQALVEQEKLKLQEGE